MSANSDFIAYLVPGAQAGFKEYGILPSITIAQGCLESGWGTSWSSTNDNNLFGIKMPGAKPAGMTITQGSYATDDGGYYRHYQSWADSVTDHGFFLKNNSRYANIIGNTDYEFVARELKRVGYATDSLYASKLISTIKANNLTQYDSSDYAGPTSSGEQPVTAASGGAGGTIDIPSTNYAVVEGSLVKSKEVLYGRMYRVIASSLDGEKALDVSQLRCTFNVIDVMQLQPQLSTVVIYNLSPQSEKIVIDEGFRVTIEAGYEGSQYGLVFDGNVIQAIRNKEDGTTYTLTLVAADSDMWMSYSISNFTATRGQNSRSILAICAATASVLSELGGISESLSDSKLTRGKSYFGMTKDCVRLLAGSENATAYVTGGKINFIKASDVPEGEIIDLSSASGMIGVPEQSNYGVTIRSLLNPRLKVNTLVHVDNSLVRAQQFDQGQQVYSLDKDGIYRIIQVTTIGDTRGNDWYTEVETVTQSGKLPAMVTSSAQAWT